MAENAPQQTKKKEKKVTKKPSALKRDQQSEKRRLRNRSHRATLLTAVRGFEGSIAKKESPEALRKKLDAVYRLMDKGVKKGVFTVNKAARAKSRLFARVKKAAAV